MSRMERLISRTCFTTKFLLVRRKAASSLPPAKIRFIEPMYARLVQSLPQGQEVAWKEAKLKLGSIDGCPAVAQSCRGAASSTLRSDFPRRRKFRSSHAATRAYLQSFKRSADRIPGPNLRCLRGFIDCLERFTVIGGRCKEVSPGCSCVRRFCCVVPFSSILW